MKFIYKIDGLIFAWFGEDNIYLYKKLAATYDKMEPATYTRKSNLYEKNVYEMTRLERDRLKYIYQKLVMEKKDKLAFSRFLYRIFLGWANIAEFYNFTYVKDNTYYEELWLAFTDPEKAKEYIRSQKEASIENPKNWADGIMVNFTEEPWECGGLNAELYYED